MAYPNGSTQGGRPWGNKPEGRLAYLTRKYFRDRRHALKPYMYLAENSHEPVPLFLYWCFLVRRHDRAFSSRKTGHSLKETFGPSPCMQGGFARANTLRWDQWAMLLSRRVDLSSTD
ncbi:unnamed protein product [Ectocarpus sp. 13 AM-2016]